VQGEDEKLWTVLDLCRDTDGAGLVYAGSREKCEQLARMLRRHGSRPVFTTPACRPTSARRRRTGS
jgi:superfamily II DNA helicase RecQ